MTKKKIPDWLNSSMWSTPPPTFHDDDDGIKSLNPTPPVEPSRHIRVRSADSRSDRDSKSTVTSVSRTSTSKGAPDHGDSRSEDERGLRAAEEGIAAETIALRAQFLTELSRKIIDVQELRRLASHGIPDDPGIRSTVWKLLLGYLPPDRSLWAFELSKKRSQYRHLKDDLLTNPSEITRKMERSYGDDNDKPNRKTFGLLPRTNIVNDEHPLSLGKGSIWNKYFQESEILLQIDRDVKRTHPDIPFFAGDSPFVKSNQEALRCILTVFAKLNTGIRYVQGMNEILAPLFYVFRSDPDDQMNAFAEADSFYCFTELISGFRDLFCQHLDNSIVGIRSTITKLSLLVKRHDEELWRHLEVISKVNPQFYAFRWITLLLTQEFKFAEILRIWDVILSDSEGPLETLLRICCAMLILVRRRLLGGDFTSIMKLLQRYPPTNIAHLLYVANKLRASPFS